MLSFRVKVTGFDYGQTSSRIYKNRRVGLYVGSTAAKYMDPFVPYLEGDLSKSYRVEPFKVEYYKPYAHRLFNGDGFNFTRDQHPLATAHWDKAMTKSKGRQLGKDIQDYIRRGI